MAERKQVIKDRLLKYGKSYKWLHDELRKKGIYRDIYYVLSDASKTFDVELSTEIDDIFNRNGMMENENEHCNHLSNELYHLNELIGHSLSLINSTFKKFGEDNYFSFDEKRMLMTIIEQIEENFNGQLNHFKKVIKNGE